MSFGFICKVFRTLIRLSKHDEFAESTFEKECNKKTTQAASDYVILAVLRDKEKV